MPRAREGVRAGGYPSSDLFTGPRPIIIRTMNSRDPGPDLDERLARLLEPRSEVLDAYLFGSQARGEAQAHSDVDVAVYVDDRLMDDSGFGYRARLTADLMAGLGLNLIDVVLLNRAPPLLYHRVLRDGVRVVSRDLRATTAREGRALSRYCDFVPQLEKVEAAHRWAEGDGEG